ncbi:NADH:ubiquinone oxidoreductase, partial [Salinivibrio sp. MA427]
MVFLVITALTVLGGVLAGEHFHSYLLGFGVASTAV